MADRPVPKFSEDDEARFWAKVFRGGPDECWHWRHRTARRPEFRIGAVKYPAAQIVLWLAGRERPAGAGALHSCDDEHCVNEGHLRWGTQLENMRDKVARGRHVVGEACKGSVLTEDAIRKIRAAVGETTAALARRHGVTWQTVNSILLGHTWKHVD